MVEMLARLLSFTLIIFFVGTMFFGLFNLSTGMDMTGGESSCLFMSHGENICTMNFAEHIGAWQKTFLTMAPSALWLMVTASVLLYSLPPNLLFKPILSKLTLVKRRKEYVYSFSRRVLQEFFSNGILHPKLF